MHTTRAPSESDRRAAASRARDQMRDLPSAPPLRRLVGPSVILIGVGIASGEYILYPYIASRPGLTFLWAAVVGILVQYFIKMEIERYTLATGETASAASSGCGRPGARCRRRRDPGHEGRWATAVATVTTFAVGGGDPNGYRRLVLIASVLLLGTITVIVAIDQFRQLV